MVKGNEIEPEEQEKVKVEKRKREKQKKKTNEKGGKKCVWNWQYNLIASDTKVEIQGVVNGYLIEAKTNLKMNRERE